MNNQTKSNSSLLLAYQQDSTTIPSDFLISCLLSTKPKGIFESSFHLDNLVVCGTNQGPIVLMGLNRKENKFQRVSLLCGHANRITDIKETLQGDSFISISSNSTICLWSLYDGSCLVYSDLLLPINDYKLSICPSGPSHIWIWALGSNLYLYDFENEQIAYSLYIDGLQSFSILSPHISYCVTTTLAICSTISKVITYTINDNQTLNFSKEIPFYGILSQNIKVCQRGLIKYSSIGGNWSIINPINSKSILSGIFNLDDDDLISDVNWNFTSFFCIATYKAHFLIVTMKKSSDLNTNISSITIVSERIIKPNLFSIQISFSIINNNEVAFTPDSKSVVILSEKSQLVLNSKKSERQYNIVESNFSCPYVVYSDGKSTISFYNAETQTSDIQRYTFDGKITTIYARNSILSNTLQIINGYEDGRISFWTVGTDVGKSTIVPALTSPINSLIELPFKLSGRQLLLAISKFECCMFKATDLYLTYNLGSISQIISVYYLSISKYLIFSLSDGSFAVCNINEPDPIYILSQLPENSILLYSNFFSFFIENITSIVCLRLSDRSLWYQFLDISRIHRFDLNNDSNNQVLKALDIIDQMISKNTNCNSSISDNSSAKKMIDDDNEIHSSLVIIGKELKPTFFYPHFSVNLENILYASPAVAAKHFLIKRLIAKMKSIDDTSYNEDSKRFVDFVPLLIKLMYETPQDSEIQQICAESCASLNFLITFIKAQNLVSPLLMSYNYSDTSRYPDHVLLMLCLFTARFHNLIPGEMLPKLLMFLIEQQENAKDKPSAIYAMSTFILIDGMPIWIKILNDHPIYPGLNKTDNDNGNSSATNSFGSNSNVGTRKRASSKKDNDKKNEKLYISIIKSVIINKKDSIFLYNRFLSYVYSEDISLLIKILPKFVKECNIKSNFPALPTSFPSSPIAAPVTIRQSNTKHAEAALELYSEMELKNHELLCGWLTIAIASVGSKFSNLTKKANSLIKKHAQLLSYIDIKNKTILIGTSTGYIYIYNDLKLKNEIKVFTDKIVYVSIGPNEECGLAISKFETKVKIFKIKLNASVVHEMEIFHPPNGTKFSARWLKNDNAAISFVPI